VRAFDIKLATLAVVAISGSLALPGSASAAISCSFSSSVVTVSLTANDFPIIVRSGNDVQIRDNAAGQTLVPCTGGTPTVTTTERIDVDQATAGQNVQLIVDLIGGPFEPGLGGPAEGGGTSEIEFDIDLGGGSDFDTVFLSPRQDPFSDHFRFGDLGGGVSGANLNPPEAGGPDGDDLRLTNVDSLVVTMGFSETVANTYDGSGGAEFSGPLDEIPIGGFGGGAGPDTVIGGDRGGIYDGFDGNDTLFSSPESPFSETLRGGDATDTLEYSRATSAVTVDLGTAAIQDTGGGGFDVLDLTDFENLTGGPFGDTLTGTSGANRIVGAAGVDDISLLAGADQFDVLDGGPDTVDCGGDGDSGVADEQGVDTLTNCEMVDFPPQTSIAAGPANGATISDPTPTYTLAANEPATFQRRVDGGPFQPCQASCTVPSLSDGAHSLAFRATDQDPPATADPTPVTRAVTVDTSPPSGGGGGGDDDPPETTILSGPKKKTKKKSVTFRFSSNEGGSTFECALDEKAFSPCSSPARVKARKKGRHSFDVHAVDAAGNVDQTPATHSWKRKRKRR
jgi:hypothetical protein